MQLFKHSKEPEVYYYFNKKGEKLWMFRHKYYDNTGKRKEKKKSGFKTDKTAIKALLEVKAQTMSGQTKQVEYDNLTVSQWLDIWFETNKNSWKDTTRIQRQNAIRLQMKPLLGKYKLQKLDKSTYIREYINVLKVKYKPRTVELFHKLFKVAINAAVDDEILPRNRFTKISIFNEDISRKEEDLNYFKPEQLVLFLSTAKKEENITNYTFILTVAYTGLRKGEAFGLQWKNIDLTNKTITVERTRDNKGVRTPKTSNSYRKILIDDLLIQQLKTYRKWCKETMISFGYHCTDESFVFTCYQTGVPISDNSVLYAFRRILNKCNLSNVTIHGLRHTHATILLNSGQNVKVIAERLGNTPEMILNIYGHVLKEAEAESVALFNRTLETSGAKIGANKT